LHVQSAHIEECSIYSLSMVNATVAHAQPEC
jgi:hypothetical protein